ncbi:MAG: glycosyltransferase family 39 protein, partial [Anaerolineae bacterium]|nr:glycosyltransferase family 39 protein [Anaerolineae bacterium]
MAQEAKIYRTAAPPRAIEWLTVERAGYALAVIVALGVRLYGLGEAPLGPLEATQALPAVDAMRGLAPDLAGQSALLHVLQRVTFIVAGATDGAARVWPALLAGLSPLLFYFLRHRLTRGGALAAAFIWSLSPLGVWSSRTGTGDALVPTFALALMALLAWEERGRWWAALTGLIAGLLLASGPNAYTVILAGAAALFVFRGSVRLPARPSLAYAGLGFLAALLVASFFLAEPAALAAVGELPGRWLSDLIPGRGDYGPVEIIARLLLAELFALGFGIAGLVIAIRRRDRFGIWLGIATGLALLVALVGRGRDPSDLALVALGLTLLAGPAVARVVGNAYEWRRERDPWLLFLVSLALLIAASFALPSGFNMTNTGDWRFLYIGVGVATLAMTLIVWIAYGIWDSWGVVGRVVPAVLLVIGFAWQVSEMVALSYDRGAWRQSGIVHELPAA